MTNNMKRPNRGSFALLLPLIVGSDAFYVPSGVRHPHNAIPGIGSNKFQQRYNNPASGSEIFTVPTDQLSNELEASYETETGAGTQVEEAARIQLSNSNIIGDDNPLATTDNDNISTETPSFRDCIAFALPALGMYICAPLMSLIDAGFIGRLSTSVELAALGPASSISDSSPLPLLFLSIASTNLIAKAFSRNDTESLARVSRTALGMGGIGGTVLAVLLYSVAQPLSAVYCGGGISNPLVVPCSTYVAIRAFALPFVVLSTIAQAISIGTKDTRTPLISVALAGALNLFGDLILVKYLGMGIAGAAWATSMSQVLSAGLLLRVLKKRGFLEKPVSLQTNNNNGSTMATIRQLMSFIPFLFIMGVKIGWHNSCASTAASFGGAKAAAHTALLSVAMLCFLLGDAGSSMAQAFLPAFTVQKGDTERTTAAIATTTKNDALDTQTAPVASFDLEAARPTMKQLLKCTLAISTAAVGLSSVLIGLMGHQITSDVAVLAEMKKALPWIVTALSFHGSAVTLEGLLLVRKKFKALSVCYTALAVIVAAFQFATKRFNLGLAGVWGCYVFFCASRVVTFSALGGLLRPRRWLERLRGQVFVRSSTKLRTS